MSYLFIRTDFFLTFYRTTTPTHIVRNEFQVERESDMSRKKRRAIKAEFW